MNTPRPPVLSDESVRAALTRLPDRQLTVELLADISVGIERMPQRLALAWPWSPSLPGMPPSRARSWLPVAAILVALALLVGLALVAIVGSAHRLPPPFGLAKTGSLAFSDQNHIVLVDAAGGVPRAITAGPRVDWEPTWSPDGTKLAFWSRSARDERIAEGKQPAGYAVTGPANLTMLDLATGSETVLADSVMVTGPPPHGGGYSWFGSEATISWSPDDSRIAFSSQIDGHGRLSIARADRSELTSIGPGSLDAWDPTWSPNGVTIAFRDGSKNGVGLIESDGSDLRYVATDHLASGRDSFVPQWSPDGRRIAFSVGIGSLNDVWVVGVDGTGEQNLSRDPQNDNVWPAWSPDGQKIAFVRRDGPALAIVAADGSGTSRIIRHPNADGDFDFTSSTPFWSPDGHWIGGLLQGGTNHVDDRFVVLDATGDGSPRTIRGSMIGSGSWQRLAP